MTRHATRLFWMDVIRALAIFLVVLTHSIGISYPLIQSDPTIFSLTFFQSVVRIAIPLFVMVSGALLLSKDESAIHFYRNRISKLLLPWIFWSCMYMLWYLWTGERSASSLLTLLKNFYVIFMSQFWFLPMICGLYFFTPLLRIILKKTSQQTIILAMCLWLVYFSVLPIINNHQPYVSPYYVLEHIGYYVLGYLIVISKREFSQVILFLLFLLAILFQMLGLQMQQLNILPHRDFIDHNTSPFIIIASLSLFSLFKQFFSRKHIPEWGRERITFFAITSFGVFLTHDLVRMMVTRGEESLLHPPLPYFLTVLWNTLFILLLSSSLIFLLKRLGLGKYLIR